MMNAIEAMSGAGGDPRELLVRSGIYESQGVLVSVQDSGPGFDPKSLDHLFDAFATGITPVCITPIQVSFCAMGV